MASDYIPPPPIQTSLEALGPNSDAFSPFTTPPISPVATPRDLVPKGPLPYQGDVDLEKAIQAAMRAKDTKAWKVLIQARTVQNNVTKAPPGVVGEELRPALQKLGWTDNEIKWAQVKADGDLLEGIKLLLKDEAHRTSLGGSSRMEEEEEEDDDDAEDRDDMDPHGQDPPITSAVLRRLSIDSTWHLLQSTSASSGDEGARRRAWKENALLLVQVSSLQRQGRLSPLVKKKMKAAIAHGLGDEVRHLLKVLHQQDKHRDSVDREDSLFTCYKCPLTDDLLYEPVTLGCGHTFSKRALEGVISSGNRKCPICRGAISSENADELKVNLLLRDTITRLFSDRILQLVKRDIAALKSENIETAAEELLCILQRYRANEDIIDMAVHTIYSWTQERKNLAPLSRRGLGRELMTLLGMPAFRISLKFQRRTAVVILQSLSALGSGSAHGTRVLNDGSVWGPAVALLEKPKIKGNDLVKLATEVYRLVTLALKGNQEPATISLDISSLLNQVLVFILENQQSKGLVTAGLGLMKELVLLGQIKNMHTPPLSSSNALQVLGLWITWASSAEVVCAAASVICTATFQKNDNDGLLSALIAAGAVQLGLEALVAIPEDEQLLLNTVPLLLRLGFSTDEEICISNETVCHKLKAPPFVADVGRYLALLEKAEHDQPLEDPIVFEKTSSSKIDIQDNGDKVMANGKGWVLGSAITSGTWTLTYEVLQEDKGDECSCLGISLVPDPPATADYRSTGSPFITLRCFSGEVYRESRVLYASESFKVHPGRSVKVTLDLEAGSLSFQVNDGPSTLVASDLKGRTLYPSAYFYLGEGQPDRSTHPIIRLTTSGSQVAGASSMTVDAALTFNFPTASSGIIYQEGQTIKRRAPSRQMATRASTPLTPSSSSALSSALSSPLTYLYGVGPGEMSGVHTYLFKAMPSLSVCFGIVAGDVIDPQVRLGSGPPDSINSLLLIAMWSSGRMVSRGLPEGLQPITYEGQDFIKPEEPVTFRLRLESRERILEVVRGAKVIHSIIDLDQRLPVGMALHPFVALLSPDDSVGVEYRILSQRRGLGGDKSFDRKKWVLDIQSMLRDFNAARRSSRTPSIDPPSRLSLSVLLHYLEEPAGPYKPYQLLEEVAIRASSHSTTSVTDGLVTMDIAKSICRAMSRCVENVKSPIREKAEEILAQLELGLDGPDSPERRGVTGALIRSGLLELVLSSNDRITSAGYKLLKSIMRLTSSPALQAYLVDLGVVPKLLSITGSSTEEALDMIVHLFQGTSPSIQAIRVQVVSMGLLPTMAKRLVTRYIESNDAAVYHALISLLSGAGKGDEEILLYRLAQQGAIMTSANPYLIEPDILDLLSTPALAAATAPGDVSMQRRKVTELQEGWRGHVSKAGVPSASWNEAAFWALKEGDVSLLRMLLAAPHFAAFIADRAAFSPGWPGPWVGVLSKPVSLLGAYDELHAVGHGKGGAETRALLVNKAQAFRRQKRDSMDERIASSPSLAPPGRYCRHPRADGSMGLFAVSAEATLPFGFCHNDLVYVATVPAWGYARVLGVESNRLWLQFQGSAGAVASSESGWAALDLRLIRANKDPGSGGASTTFRLPLERGTRVVRGPHWEWGNQDSFNGNVGTVLGNGGGDGWYRVQWDTTNTSNSYQYMESHQDLARYNDPLENPLATLFPPISSSQYINEVNSVDLCSASTSIAQANVRTSPTESLDEAGFKATLDILETIWSHASSKGEPDLIWYCLAKLGLTQRDRLSSVFERTEPPVKAAMKNCKHPSALLLLACAARNGPEVFLEKLSEECPFLLGDVLAIMVSPASSDKQIILGLCILDALASRSASCAKQVVELLLQGHTLEDSMLVILKRLINPSHMTHASIHIMTLRFLRQALEADKRLGKKLMITSFKRDLVSVLEVYTRFSPSELIVDELLALVTQWFQGFDDVAVKEEAKHITLMANAFFDDFESVCKTLTNAPRSLLCAATLMLQRAVTSHRDAGSQERTVSLILRSHALELLYEGHWDLVDKDREQILELANLIEVLLDASPTRKDDIVSLSLVKAIWPGLDADDPKVVYAVLRILEKHLPGESSQKEKRKKSPSLWWSTIGIGDASLSTSLATTYARFTGEDALASLVLKVLDDVVQETGSLDRIGLETLIAAQASVKTREESAVHITTILRIFTAACKTLQSDTEMDMDQMIKTVAQWLVDFADDRIVIDAGLQLFLSLVDESHIILPEEVALSSGSLAINKLFVTPLKYREATRILKASSSTAQSTSSSSHFDRSDTAGGHEAWTSAPRATFREGEGDDDEGEEIELQLEEDGFGEEEEAEEDDEEEGDGFGEDIAGDGNEENEDDHAEDDDDDDDSDSDSRESVRVVAQPGWQPTRTRLPHYVQLHLPRNKDGTSTWRVLDLEQRDFQNNTPKIMEVSVGKLGQSPTPGGSLPVPVTSLRRIRMITQSNHRQTGWLSLIQADEMKGEEDVIEIRISANFGADETATKLSRFRILARTRTSLERIREQLKEARLLPSILGTAVVNAEKDRIFLRTVTLYLRRFFPEALRDLKEKVGSALANSEYDLRRGQAAGITFSDDGKRATFPFGPKLLISALDTSEGVLRWIFKSSGNSSWAVGAIPKSKVDRHDVMMAESTLAVATTGLAGGRISLRRQIQNRKLEVVVDMSAGCLMVTGDDDRDNPIVVDLPVPPPEPYHLALMGYSGTNIHFLDDF